MKSAIILFFSLITIGGFGQHMSTPVYYLNGQETDLENVYVKSTNIDSIRVGHKTSQGEVYMWMRKPVTFLTLDDILKNNGTVTSAGEVVYIVNDKVINDKWKVKIDASYSIRVDVKRLDGVGYLEKNYHNLVIAQITLKPEPQIMIRGFQHTASTK